MRNIVIFLLFLNLAYFGWNMFTPESDDIRSAQTLPAARENTLVLLSELEAPLPQVQSGPAVIAQSSAICLNIGSFSNIEDANEVIAYLASEGVQSDLTFASTELNSLFLVYLPPFSSRGIAVLTLESVDEAVKTANLEVEGNLITGGVLENGIAFGVFESAEEAANTQSVLAGLGYNAEIDREPLENNTVQVVVRMAEFPLVDTQIWKAIQIERPYLTQTEILCETIAQGTQFP